MEDGFNHFLSSFLPMRAWHITVSLPSPCSPYTCDIVIPRTSSLHIGDIKAALFHTLALAPQCTASDSGPVAKMEGAWCTFSVGQRPKFNKAAQRTDVDTLLAYGSQCYRFIIKWPGCEAGMHLHEDICVPFGRHHWYLVPLSDSLSSRFLIQMTGRRIKTDAFGKEYVAFQIGVKNGNLAWQLSKRFSEFASMHGKFCRHLEQRLQKWPEEYRHLHAYLPALPPRLWHKSAESLDGRQKDLEVYLQRLLDVPIATEDPHVLAFLGIVSSLSAELASPSAEFNAHSNAMKQRKIIHVSSLNGDLEMGDIILFQCAHALAGLQRGVTRAEWDHVALVVKRQDGRGCDLLESTCDGVTCVPLSARMAAYATEFTSYMGVRKLQGQRTAAMEKKLQGFVERINGRPYGFPLTTLFAKKYITSDTDVAPVTAYGLPSPKSNTWHSNLRSVPFYPDFLNNRRRHSKVTALSASNSSQADSSSGMEVVEKARRKFSHERGFFCSNLVAAALREMCVLKADINDDYFWPGAFTEGGEIDDAFRDGYCLSDVMLVDTATLELGRATFEAAEIALSSSK